MMDLITIVKEKVLLSIEFMIALTKTIIRHTKSKL